MIETNETPASSSSTIVAEVPTPILSKTYNVVEENLPELRFKVGKLIKRAEKLGVPAIKMTIGPAGEPERIKNTLPDGTDVVVKIVVRYPVTIEGEAPHLAGWAFCGTLQQIEGVEGNVVRTVPGMTIPEKYRSVAPACEHCNTNRRRNDTFVVMNIEDFRTKQVGRQCLADFLGHKDPHMLARYAEYFREIGELCESAEGFGGAGSPSSCDMVTFLTYVSAAIRQDGWLSRTAARNSIVPRTATADWAMRAMWPGKMTEKEKAELPKPVAADKERAEAALDWCENVFAPRQGSDYEYNLKLICGHGSDVLNLRCTGIAASLLQAHMRFLGKEEERKARPEETSQHFGTVGERVQLILKVEGMFETQTDYGAMTIITFRTPEGNVAKWFASGVPQLAIVTKSESAETRDRLPGGDFVRYEDLVVGETYRVKGTIKKHVTWTPANSKMKPRPETVLSRCTIINKASDPEPTKPKKSRKAKKSEPVTTPAASPEAGSSSDRSPMSEEARASVELDEESSVRTVVGFEQGKTLEDGTCSITGYAVGQRVRQTDTGIEGEFVRGFRIGPDRFVVAKWQSDSGSLEFGFLNDEPKKYPAEKVEDFTYDPAKDPAAWEKALGRNAPGPVFGPLAPSDEDRALARAWTSRFGPHATGVEMDLRDGSQTVHMDARSAYPAEMMALGADASEVVDLGEPRVLGPDASGIAVEGAALSPEAVGRQVEGARLPYQAIAEQKGRTAEKGIVSQESRDYGTMTIANSQYGKGKR